MKKDLLPTTKPGETYVQLGHMIKRLSSGDRMPPFSKLLKQLKITQRSLDIAYKRLQEEGVLELKKQSGVYVRKPYAGGKLLFIAAEDVFLSHKTGENLRLYFAELRRRLHHYFPESSMDIILTESPDTQHYDREPQLRQQLVRENNQKRIIGAFVSYHVTEQETIDTFDALDIPFVDIEGNCLKIVNQYNDATVMIKHLAKLGYKNILVISSLEFEPQQLMKCSKSNLKLTCHSLDNEKTGVDLIECGITFIKKLIESNEMPDAFAVLDDYFCQGMLIGAYIKGVILEDEYGLISTSQQGEPIHSNHPIMRLNYCWDRIADAASMILLEKLHGQEINEPVIVSPSLEI